ITENENALGRMSSQSQLAAVEKAVDRLRMTPISQAATVSAEATNPASHRENEAMARRRFQKPTPFQEGNFWWLRVWDTSKTGSRKRQRIKLANADMPVREVQKIVEEKLRPMNQGLGLTGSAMALTNFMEDTYIPRYLRTAAAGHASHLSSST